MSYYHYTYMTIEDGYMRYGWGITQQLQEDFNFLHMHVNNPDYIILSVSRISEGQFKELEKITQKA